MTSSALSVDQAPSKIYSLYESILPAGTQIPTPQRNYLPGDVIKIARDLGRDLAVKTLPLDQRLGFTMFAGKVVESFGEHQKTIKLIDSVAEALPKLKLNELDSKDETRIFATTGLVGDHNLRVQYNKGAIEPLTFTLETFDWKPVLNSANYRDYAPTLKIEKELLSQVAI